MTGDVECFGEVFNIGCGGQYTLNELVQYINRGLNTNIKPIFGERRPGDIPHSSADIAKSKNMLGYEPAINFECGVGNLCKLYN